MESSILSKLFKIQQGLKSPRKNKSNFGMSRSAEDILEDLKPLLKDNKCVLTLSEEVKCLSNEKEIIIVKGKNRLGDDEITKTESLRYYIICTATIYDIETGESHCSSSTVRESQNKKGVDDSQITGATISYARKYTLGGLFCLDDTTDADNEVKNK